MSFPYRDHRRLVMDLTPGIAARDLAGDYLVGLLAEQSRLHEGLGDLYQQLADIEAAEGAVLDLHGEREGEARQGLGDREYRRILAGRKAANGGISTWPRLWAGWLALTGSTQGSAEALPPCSIYLEGHIDFTPSQQWLARAGAVVRSLIPATGYANAVVIRTGQEATFDTRAAFDRLPLAYTLTVQGAS